MADVQLPPLRPITLEAQDGTKHAFRPQSDITALEAVLVAQLFTRQILNAWQGPVDWPAYVNENGLARHFVRVDLPVPSAVVTSRSLVESPEAFSTDTMKLTVTEGRRVALIAERDIGGNAAEGKPPTWYKGAEISLFTNMPVPEGFVEATPEAVARIQEELAAAGGVR